MLPLDLALLGKVKGGIDGVRGRGVIGQFHGHDVVVQSFNESMDVRHAEVPEQALMGSRVRNAQPGAGAVHGFPLDRGIESFDVVHGENRLAVAP